MLVPKNNIKCTYVTSLFASYYIKFLSLIKTVYNMNYNQLYKFKQQSIVADCCETNICLLWCYQTCCETNICLLWCFQPHEKNIFLPWCYQTCCVTYICLLWNNQKRFGSLIFILHCRVEKKERARLRNVKFPGKAADVKVMLKSIDFLSLLFTRLSYAHTN